MTDIHADADAALDTDADHHHDEDETCPDCGEAHEVGFGEPFLRWVEMLGVESEAVRSIIAQQLIKRGIVTQEQVDAEEVLLSRDALSSIVHELAFPSPRTAHYDWEANDEAFAASAYLAMRLVRRARDLSMETQAVAQQGYRLHPQHLTQVMDALSTALRPIETAFALQTNPLRPEANVTLDAQASSDIVLPEGETAFDIDGGKFGERFDAQVDANWARYRELKQRVREVAAEQGVDPMAAVAIVNDEIKSKIKAEAEADLGGEA